MPRSQPRQKQQQQQQQDEGLPVHERLEISTGLREFSGFKQTTTTTATTEATTKTTTEATTKQQQHQQQIQQHKLWQPRSQREKQQR